MATERIETTILRNLLHNEEYYRKVVPFLKQNIMRTTMKKLSMRKLLTLLLSTIKYLLKKFLRLISKIVMTLLTMRLEIRYRQYPNFRTNGLTTNGSLTPQKNGVKTEQSTSPSCGLSKSQTEAIKNIKGCDTKHFTRSISSIF